MSGKELPLFWRRFPPSNDATGNRDQRGRINTCDFLRPHGATASISYKKVLKNLSKKKALLTSQHLVEMVHIVSGLYFLFALATTGSALPTRRDFNQLQADIGDINNKTGTLDTQLTAFPPSDSSQSLGAALTIHNSANALITSLNTGTTDGQANGAFSEAEGQTVLSEMIALKPTISHALDEVVAKKPDFEALPITGLTTVIHQDLVNMQSATANFSNALIADAPADLQANATALRDEFVGLFNAPIANYTS
ncbi:hypothetical protein AX17_001710 [Amanita inopinata Kibby_2008]|nr:hypothetical protein AX17_001710 [Amanita inopinata Kibby_2008]